DQRHLRSIKEQPGFYNIRQILECTLHPDFLKITVPREKIQASPGKDNHEESTRKTASYLQDD
ncbi:MAG TPA: hypothetical protein PKI59_07260, partial [Candidatus Cloacimonadota bacterium]|nr:hypothetical protein [Candidatus Cloacimonadota bacterium]